MKEAIKAQLHRLGLYSIVRDVYRSLHRGHREERRLRQRFFAQLVAPGDLCYDIGANVGQTTEALLACGASVVALEPNPHCLPTLKHQFGRDPRVTLVQAAVGRAPGRADLHFRGSSATASLRDDWQRGDDKTVEVNVVTLDNLMARHGVPRLLKVDVEGYELEVFLGLGRPIPIVYFEMHASELETVAKIVDHLRSLGGIEGINVISEDHSAWLWSDWSPGDAFMARLSSAPLVANIVVRMSC